MPLKSFSAGQRVVPPVGEARARVADVAEASAPVRPCSRSSAKPVIPPIESAKYWPASGAAYRVDDARRNRPRR